MSARGNFCGNSATAALFLILLAGCRTQTKRRHVFPTGFQGTFLIVMDSSAPAMRQTDGWLVIEYDKSGIAYMNARDEVEFRHWGTDRFEYADGTKLTQLLPGQKVGGLWAQVNTSESVPYPVDVNGKKVYARLDYIEGLVGNGP